MIDMLYNFRQGDIHSAEFSDEFNKLCILFEDYGIFVIDLAYSTKIIMKIRNFAEEKQVVVRLEELREQINYSIERRKPKFVLSMKTERPFREMLEKYLNM